MTDTTENYIILDPDFARKIAKHLLDINAVVLRPNEPFTWASGWNSPIYCDNRLTLRYPEIRKEISQGLIRIIEKHFSDVDVITGTATAGIPHAAWVAGSLNKPLAYVRAKAKSYGLGNQIEGGVDKGQSTLVIEDLISTGGSAVSVIEALQFIGAEVRGVLSIFTYGFEKATEKFNNLNIPVYCLTDYQTLIEVAVDEGRIEENDLDLLNAWRENPSEWPN
ncbi:orotate phosphoribosyltransferase [Rhodohalobacter mucosus]|uniref:Orotate phosphoribosyltransferase n=1 Tax=Rhodohalobacter mucosus TaxID=2079485 RepID=A0A316TSN7_9BACT|nr:orotate phosphoribosyltransferase [Rhodohalobacter mucosus]PWN05274.1 orotate phosphoribosyltransferase [Rhodohalobacter mucosus]